jgi:hypothetical protein
MRWDALSKVRELDCHEMHVAGEFGHNDFYPVVMAAAQAIVP